MIRPKNFGYNEETATSNAFQRREQGLSPNDVKKLAGIEFDNLVHELITHQIEVQVFDDLEKPIKPDAVFPNNWFSTHEGEVLITYPLLSKLRRNERREDIVEKIINDRKIKRYKFEFYEDDDQFLEGTGSLVLDRTGKLAFACLSDRTHPGLLDKFCVLMGYEAVMFNAVDQNNMPIYHTNVVMMMGTNVVVICLEAIADEEEKKFLLDKFQQSGKKVLEINLEQMSSFAGNMLQLKNKLGEYKIVLSRRAYDSLEPEQIGELKQHGDLIIGQINTIETYGGGSVRCMIAENFL